VARVREAAIVPRTLEDRPPYGALVDVYHVARRIREEEIGEGSEPPFRGALYSWDEGDPLPEKPTYDVREFFQQYIAVSVSGFDRFPRDRNVTFFPPYLPDLNEYYGRELYHHYAQARAEYGLVGGAIGLLVPIHTSDITLRALPSLELTTRLLALTLIRNPPNQSPRILPVGK
jgi:hypothetical protein